MPADGSIIIDTRVNNKGAEADLKALQAKAKSTAQQIAALDKQLNTATGKRTKLADDYEATTVNANLSLEMGEIDAMIDPEQTREAIAESLRLLAGKKRVRRTTKHHGNQPL